MGKFARNNNGDTIQAMPISYTTEEGAFTNKLVGNIDTLRALDDGAITFTMRDSSTIVINALTGEDFGITEDVISFTSDASVRVG